MPCAADTASRTPVNAPGPRPTASTSRSRRARPASASTSSHIGSRQLGVATRRELAALDQARAGEQRDGAALGRGFDREEVHRAILSGARYRVRAGRGESGQLAGRMRVDRIRIHLGEKAGLRLDAIDPRGDVREIIERQVRLVRAARIREQRDVGDRVRIARDERPRRELAIENAQTPSATRRAAIRSTLPRRRASLPVMIQCRSVPIAGST